MDEDKHTGHTHRLNVQPTIWIPAIGQVIQSNVNIAENSLFGEKTTTNLRVLIQYLLL